MDDKTTINKDLLLACKMALPWIGKLIAEGLHEECVNPGNCIKAMEELKNAIAKARLDNNDTR